MEGVGAVRGGEDRDGCVGCLVIRAWEGWNWSWNWKGADERLLETGKKVEEVVVECWEGIV